MKSGLVSASLFLSPTAAAKWVTEARKGKGKSSALILGGNAQAFLDLTTTPHREAAS